MTLAPWKGGKARLYPRLLPLFPPHRCYVEPFGGMASVLLNKPPAEVEVYNDRDTRLVQLMAVLKWHSQELDRELDGLLMSRKMFDYYRDRTGCTDIQRSAQFLYALSLSFSGQAQSYATSKTRGVARTRTVAGIRDVAKRVTQRLQTVSIEWLDWEQCLERYDGPDSFFFCDPPYLGTEGYDIPFGEREQVALAGRLRSLKGKFLMTNSDNREVRELYRGLPMRVVRGQLSVDKAHDRVLNHLVVTNY